MPFYRVCKCTDEEMADIDLDNWNECSHYMFSATPLLCNEWTLRLLISRPPIKIDRFGVKTTIPMSEIEVGFHDSIHTMSGTKEDIIKNLESILPYPTANDMSNNTGSTDMCEVRVLWADTSRGPMIGPRGSHVRRIRDEKNIQVEIHNQNCPGEPVDNQYTLCSEFLMRLAGPKAMVIEALIHYYELNAQHDFLSMEKRFSAKNGHAREDMAYGGYGLPGFSNTHGINNATWRRLLRNFEEDF